MSAPGRLDPIARRFAVGGAIEAIEPLPGGHINESYRVSVTSGDGARTWYLLQQLNARVFPAPARVMENISHVTDHLAAHRRAGRTRLETLSLVPTTAGAGWLEDAPGTLWRMYRWVTGTHVRERPTDAAEVREAARAYGEFLFLLSDYTGPALHETIPAFHDTGARVARLVEAARSDRAGRAATAKSEIGQALAQTQLAEVLPPLVARGEVPVRIVHNDAKLANVMLDDRTGAARCVVDLDTVMPGLVLHDFGDMVRSMTTPTDEDEADLARIGVRLPLFEALAQGFLETAGGMLTPRECSLLVHGGLLITYEQAVRFLTDYLEGDCYYRVTSSEQNLRRARAQLRHLETLAAHHSELEAIVARRIALP